MANSYYDPTTGVTATSNGSASGNTAVDAFAKACREADRDQSAWVARLRESGVKIAHPDDGWVDRERNTIHFAYPHFMDKKPEFGDIVALGWHWRKERLVRLIGQVGVQSLCARWAFEAV